MESMMATQAAGPHTANRVPWWPGAKDPRTIAPNVGLEFGARHDRVVQGDGGAGRVRQAHRALVQSVHTDWRRFADLKDSEGKPVNIRSRKLYTAYGLDSLEVLHRKRRNNFLINAEASANSIIRDIIGARTKIT